jgi:reductive dehalogenase
MKNLTLEEWERKYVAVPIERFDQKYVMFSRPLWDESIKDLMRWATERSPSKEKPGYTLQDQALRIATRTGTMMHLLESDRPNPSKIARDLAEVLTPERLARNVRVSLPPADEKLEITDRGKLTRDVKNAAIYFGADAVGICRLDPRWVYSHSYGLGDGEYNPQEIPEEFQYAIVMAYYEEYAMLRYSPTYIADAETSLGYSRMAITNAYMAKFIKVLGHKAMSCSTNDVAITIPMAMHAGLGDIGRHGMVIAPRLGAGIRLSKVLTSLPLEPDGPIDFGVTEFCETCKVCAERCPSQAIPHGKRTAEAHNLSNAPGGLKWPVDAEKCIRQWARQSKPCTICISVCPFTKPDTPFHRLARWLVDHVRWADPFYTKMDKMLGYEKHWDPAGFWDAWEPQPNRRPRVKIRKR